MPGELLPVHAAFVVTANIFEPFFSLANQLCEFCPARNPESVVRPDIIQLVGNLTYKRNFGHRVHPAEPNCVVGLAEYLYAGDDGAIW